MTTSITVIDHFLPESTPLGFVKEILLVAHAVISKNASPRAVEDRRRGIEDRMQGLSLGEPRPVDRI